MSVNPIVSFVLFLPVILRHQNLILHTHDKRLVQGFQIIGFGERKSVDWKKLMLYIKGSEAEFLRGYLDTDGTVTHNTTQYWVDWATCDSVVAKGVSELLLKEGISSSIYKKECSGYRTLYTVRVRDLVHLYRFLYRLDLGVETRKQRLMKSFIKA